MCAGLLKSLATPSRTAMRCSLQFRCRYVLIYYQYSSILLYLFYIFTSQFKKNMYLLSFKHVHLVWSLYIFQNIQNIFSNIIVIFFIWIDFIIYIIPVIWNIETVINHQIFLKQYFKWLFITYFS